MPPPTPGAMSNPRLPFGRRPDNPPVRHAVNDLPVSSTRTTVRAPVGPSRMSLHRPACSIVIGVPTVNRDFPNGQGAIRDVALTRERALGTCAPGIPMDTGKTLLLTSMGTAQEIETISALLKAIGLMK